MNRCAASTAPLAHHASTCAQSLNVSSDVPATGGAEFTATNAAGITNTPETSNPSPDQSSQQSCSLQEACSGPTCLKIQTYPRITHAVLAVVLHITTSLPCHAMPCQALTFMHYCRCCCRCAGVCDDTTATCFCDGAHVGRVPALPVSPPGSPPIRPGRLLHGTCQRLTSDDRGQPLRWGNTDGVSYDDIYGAQVTVLIHVYGLVDGSVLLSSVP